MKLPGVRERVAAELEEDHYPQKGRSSHGSAASCQSDVTDVTVSDVGARRRLGSQVISREDFEVIELLGTGGFGEVKLVRCAVDNELYAMKAVEKVVLHERRHVGDDRAAERAQAERDIGVNARSWRSPFIVQLCATFQSPEKLYYIFEYCPNGELFKLLTDQRNSRFSEATARFYAAEVALAVQHLHSHDTVHRDVRLENVLLAVNGHVKLADFGYAKGDIFNSSVRPSGALPVGSDQAEVFFPPEFVRGEVYGKDLDCWQLGVATFLMLSGCLPSTESGWPGKLPCGASRAAADFCRQLLAKVRDERLGFPAGASAVRGHPFFAALSWPALEQQAVPPPLVLRRGETLHRGAGLARPTVKGLSDLLRLSGFSFAGSVMLRGSLLAKRLSRLSANSLAKSTQP